jgi:hypothetical protein
MSAKRIYRRNQLQQATGSRQQTREEIKKDGKTTYKNYVPDAILTEEIRRKKALAVKKQKGN